MAVMGLFFFVAFPFNGPSPAKRLARQRARVAFVALESLRNAVEDYRGDHGQWPGLDPRAQRSLSAPTYSERALVQQLKLHSDQDGGTLPLAEGEFTFGPYLPDGLPVNPQNGLSSVRLLEPDESFESVVDGVYGWVYDPRSGEVEPHVLPFQRTRRSQRALRSRRTR